MSSGVILVFGIFLLIIVIIAVIWYFGFRQGSKTPIYRADLNNQGLGQGQGQFQMRLSPDNLRASYDLLVHANVQTVTLVSNGINFINLTLTPVSGFPGWNRSSGVISVTPELVAALKSGQLQVQLGNLGTFPIK